MKRSTPERAKLLAEALDFARSASQEPGVTRVALLGLLVIVADGADLAPLAVLGRKLQGHAQAFNRGADVFLADLAGNYLGRTCPWKECWPGLRLSCDALHCGRRPYLHDDLATIELPRSLVVAPPVELWPAVVFRGPVPVDLEQAVIERRLD
jgi:hypothetical protein